VIRRHARLVWVGFAVAALASAWAWRIRPPACEQVVHNGVLDLGQEVADPASPWVARLTREACGDGWFTTVVFTVVEVAPHRGTAWAEVVRVSQTDRLDVAADWPAPGLLEVRVPGPKAVDLLPFAAPGLAIRVTTAP
jgi:hypothetical protein